MLSRIRLLGIEAFYGELEHLSFVLKFESKVDIVLKFYASLLEVLSSGYYSSGIHSNPLENETISLSSAHLRFWVHCYVSMLWMGFILMVVEIRYTPAMREKGKQTGKIFLCGI